MTYTLAKTRVIEAHLAAALGRAARISGSLTCPNRSKWLLSARSWFCRSRAYCRSQASAR
jgi:hypothetical protein